MPVEQKSESKDKKIIPPLSVPAENPLWLGVSEAALIGGVNTKTIRRAIQSKKVLYKIVNDRYCIDLASLIIFLYNNKKLLNKLNQFGLGQYVKEFNS